MNEISTHLKTDETEPLAEISPTLQAALDVVPQKHKKIFEGMLATGILPNVIDKINGQNPDFSGWGEGAREILAFLNKIGPEALGITLGLCYLVWGAGLIEEKFNSAALFPMRILLHAVGIGGSFSAYYFLEHPDRIGPTITNLSTKIQPFLEFIVNLWRQIESLG